MKTVHPMMGFESLKKHIYVSLDNFAIRIVIMKIKFNEHSSI